MSALAGDLPTLKDELERKVGETLQWMIVGHEKGRVTKDQLSMGLDTLFMAVAGLVGKDFIDCLTDMQDKVGFVSKTVRRHFLDTTSGNIATLQWSPGETKVEVSTRRWSGVKFGASNKESQSPQEAFATMERLGEAFLKKGWVEL